MLNDGDVINVPKLNNTVFINGEVNLPKYISFQNGISLKEKLFLKQVVLHLFQIEKKLLLNIKTANIKSTKNFFFFKFYPKIKPGSKIFVPKKPEKTSASGV